MSVLNLLSQLENIYLCLITIYLKEYYTLYDFWYDAGSNEYDKLNVVYKFNGRKTTDYINYDFPDAEFENLLKFMNNPELYKNSQKYNI